LRIAVVIPTLNGRDLVECALESLLPAGEGVTVHVIDNASSDGTAAMVAEHFPEVRLVRNEQNRGFGRPINDLALGLDADVLVLVNNDVVCEPGFVERMSAPFADPAVGSVAGVLTQSAAPERIDSAGVELDPMLQSWDYLGDRPVAELGPATPAPLGPCGGAAAYRLQAFRDAGGFDPHLFAYWEDTVLAIELNEAGWRCALAPDARGEHRHGATLGVQSERQRVLDAFGRGFVLGRYGRGPRGVAMRLGAALLDWPRLTVALLLDRQRKPIGARLRGLRAGRAAAHGPLRRTRPGVGVREAMQRHLRMSRLPIGGSQPEYLRQEA
jgi:N-acetylglucosaminyl-diphospho-decaprenol L-rhamnosyltransferase